MYIEKILGEAESFIRTMVKSMMGNATVSASETLESISINTNGEDAINVVVNKSDNISLTNLLASPQTLTASFADVGAEVNCKGRDYAAIWLKITANAATNIQLQVLAKHTSADTLECNLPIMTVSTSVVSITPEVVQFPDSNGNYLLKVELNNVIPYIQLQMKETDGGADATIDSCDITLY